MTSPLQQKIKVIGPIVVTANRLGDGAVVYRTFNGGWSADITHAEVVNTAAAATKMLTEAIADDVSAVGAYIAPVMLSPEGAPLPGNLREHIRMNGPTVAVPTEIGI
ncbi:MAG TPA: DUF2849 domain-containing protein [Xanthobacteraceae bacterium]|jgi:hypothetical protein|nr:DUF2849 domain-containing protein [Xanthobacteraceae bacterium]